MLKYIAIVLVLILMAMICWFVLLLAKPIVVHTGDLLVGG